MPFQKKVTSFTTGISCKADLAYNCSVHCAQSCTQHFTCSSRRVLLNFAILCPTTRSLLYSVEKILPPATMAHRGPRPDVTIKCNDGEEVKVDYNVAELMDKVRSRDSPNVPEHRVSVPFDGDVVKAIVKWVTKKNANVQVEDADFMPLADPESLMNALAAAHYFGQADLSVKIATRISTAIRPLSNENVRYVLNIDRDNTPTTESELIRELSDFHFEI